MDQITLPPTKSKPYLLAAVIISLGFIVSSSIGAWVFYRVKTFDNTLSVTGSATKDITSDTVKWSSSINRNVTAADLSNGYKQMAQDLAAVKDFFKQNGLSDDAYTVSPIFMNEVYKNNDNGPKEYTLRQTLTVHSNDVNKITDISKNTQTLIDKGVMFSTDSLEYYSSAIASLRVSLLAEAIKDAKARATELAQSNNQSVGQLKDASSGVVQVLQPNSADISDYGSYDTSSIQKTVMVTVHATFTLR